MCLLCFLCNYDFPAGLWGDVGVEHSINSCLTGNCSYSSFYLTQACQYIQLWMPLLKHWWRMPWIVINIVTCRIPWINWILNMDCAAGVAFASIPSAYTHYCARCLCLWIAKLCWWCIWQASLMIRWRAHHKRSVCFCQCLLCRVGQCYGFVIQQLWCRWKDSLNLSI